MRKDRVMDCIRKIVCTAFALGGLQALSALEAVVDGRTWTYSVSNGKAVLGGSAGAALPPGTTGRITVPESLGGYPVDRVERCAFIFGPANKDTETALVFPSSLRTISSFACVGELYAGGGVSPYQVYCHLPISEYGVDILFLGAAPAVKDDAESDTGMTFYRFRHSSNNGNVTGGDMFRGTVLRVLSGKGNWEKYEQDGFLGGVVEVDDVRVDVSPASGTKFYNEDGLRVTLTCTDASAEIYYTLDGSEPTTNSVKYAGPFTVNGTTTVKAVSVVGGEVSVFVTTAEYTGVKKPLELEDALWSEDQDTDDLMDIVFDGSKGKWTAVENADGTKYVEGCAEAGEDTVSLRFDVESAGVLSFDWMLSSVASDESPGSSFAVLMTDELSVKQIKGDDNGMENPSWEPVEHELLAEDIDKSGFVLLKIGFISKDRDGTYKSDVFRLRNLRWTPCQGDPSDNDGQGASAGQ